MPAESWDREHLVYEPDRSEHDRYYMRGGRGPDYYPGDPYDRRTMFDDDCIRDRRYHDDGFPRHARREREPEHDDHLVMERERDREFFRDSPRRRPVYQRRQSSLDTYDRKPLRHLWQREELPVPARREDVYRPGYRAPPYTPIPLPRRRGLPPPGWHPDQGYYDDYSSDDGEYSRDDDYRRYPEHVREREFVRSGKERARSIESRAMKSQTHRNSSPTSATSSHASSDSGSTVRNQYPKRGKTMIPPRLVSIRALIDLGYPYIEEEDMVIVLKALSQEQIDQVLRLSDEYAKAEEEVAAARSSAGSIAGEEPNEVAPGGAAPASAAPIPASATGPPASVAASATAAAAAAAHPPAASTASGGHPPAPGSVLSAPATAPLPPAPAPPASVRAPVPSHAATVVETAPPAVAPPPPPPDVVETRTVIREASPVPSAHTSSTESRHHGHAHGHRHRRHRSRAEELTVGPLVKRSRSVSRSSHDIRAEIRALERQLAHRPKGELGEREIVRTETLPDGRVIVYEEKVERHRTGPKPPRIEKDKKGPPPLVVRALLSTLT